MIVLDTNVISEVLKGPSADERVMTWLRGLREQPVTTVVNKAELLAGVSLLSAGARRSALAIAAIASVHGAGVATRDVRGFQGIGLRLVNPWQIDAN